MANFKGKGSMSDQNVIITFPVKGQRFDKKTGKLSGYYADVELNQTDYDKSGKTPQTNPHLVTYPVKGKNGKSFPNHRFFYPVSQVRKMMDPAGDNTVFTTKDPTKSGKDAYTEYDKMEKKPANFKDQFDSTRIAVKASLMTTMTKFGPRVIINTSKPITASDIPFHKGDMAKQAQSMHVAKLAEKPETKENTKAQEAENTVDPVMGNIPGVDKQVVAGRKQSTQAVWQKDDGTKVVAGQKQSTQAVWDKGKSGKEEAEEAVKEGRAIVKNNPAPVSQNPKRDQEAENKGHADIQNLPGPDADDTNTAMDLSDDDMPF